MNLYLVSQREQTGYDTYDSMVVSAISEEAAKKICPMSCYKWNNNGHWDFVFFDGKREPETRDDWANKLENIKAKYLGKYEGTESKIIITSFNAG